MCRAFSALRTVLCSPGLTGFWEAGRGSPGRDRRGCFTLESGRCFRSEARCRSTVSKYSGGITFGR